VAVLLKQEFAFEEHPRDAFKAYISKARSEVESELARFIARLPELSLHSQIEYAVLSKGKRLRPLLVIMSAESVGGSRKKIMPLALAFEFMHTATLVHDDIIDQDDKRRDRPAIHKKWSLNQALLAGDSLIALAVDLASTYGQTIMKTVARSALDLCDGENMDITFSPKMMTEESYFQKIRKKSASLFQAATYSGALAGGGTLTEVNSLSTFGENFGMAYQLRDDLLDLTNKNPDELKDLRRGRLTLPLIHSYSHCSPDERRQIDDSLQTFLNTASTSNMKSTKRILEVIRKTGSREYCERRVDVFSHQAIAEISKLKQPMYRTYLVEMVNALKSPG
jgi:geranylgeranyl pyrophosphate synthase